MTKIKWIGTSNFKEDIANLIANNDIVFIEFEFHTVLMRMISAVKELHPNYTTKLFDEADWLKWNYDDPNNLTQLKDEMMRNPNDRYYLEIRSKEQYYTYCNNWTVNRALEKNKGTTVLATTMSYARVTNQDKNELQNSEVTSL